MDFLPKFGYLDHDVHVELTLEHFGTR